MRTSFARPTSCKKGSSVASDGPSGSNEKTTSPRWRSALSHPLRTPVPSVEHTRRRGRSSSKQSAASWRSRRTRPPESRGVAAASRLPPRGRRSVAVAADTRRPRASAPRVGKQGRLRVRQQGIPVAPRRQQAPMGCPPLMLQPALLLLPPLKAAAAWQRHCFQHMLPTAVFCLPLRGDPPGLLQWRPPTLGSSALHQRHPPGPQ